MLVLRDTDVATLLAALACPDALAFLHALWATLATFSRDSHCPSTVRTQHQPHRQEISTCAGNTSLFMPSSDTDTAMGIKVVTLPAHGPIQGALSIFSPDGRLDGIINAAQTTAFRTALAVMIPFSRFPLPYQAHILIFGGGKQAEWHARLVLLLAHERVSRLSVLTRQPETAGAFDQTVLAPLRIQYPEVSIDTCLSRAHPDYEPQLRMRVGEADAICCCTPTTEPLFPDEYRQANPKRRFISLIGSYRPHMHEVDSNTLLAGQKVLVDSKEACLVESGEIISAGIQADQLVELGDLFDQREVQDPFFGGEQTVVFKCVGLGIMDLMAGRELLRLAREHRVGIEINEF